MNGVLPNNLDAERAVLGSMMMDDEDQTVIPSVLQILDSKDRFYNSKNGLIFDAIRRMYGSGTPVDLLTVVSQMEADGTLKNVGGVPYLDEMIEIVPSVANVEFYAQQVMDAYVRRVVIRSAANMQIYAYDPTQEIEAVIEAAEGVVFALREERRYKGISTARSVVGETVEYFKDIGNSDHGIFGLTTGFHELDMMTSGLHASEFIVVAGRPGMGKSVFAQNIISHVAENGISPLLFSLEMSSLNVGMRMLSAETGIDFHLLRTGRMQDESYGKLTVAQGKISDLPVFIDDTPGLSAMQIRAKVHKMVATEGIGVVVVDYLQLMRPSRKAQNREQEIGGISTALKNIAREFDIPVIACAQLNRSPEGRENKRPTMADLRDSGRIEQDADLVMFLYRPQYYDSSEPVDIAEVIISKQRNGPTGTVKLLFQGKYLRFRELS